MSGDAHLILVAGALLAAGVLASVAAARLRLPALILFLGVGMAVGSDGLGWIYLDDYALARLVGTVALVVILFEGGLQTGFQTLRPVLGSRLSLAERGLLGWAGLRGGIPVVLATLPVIDHVRGSVEFFDLVFFAVLVSTLLQGATVEALARRLGLSGDGG